LNQKNIDIIHNSFPILEFKKYKNKKIDKDNFLNTDNHFTILTPGRFVNEKGHIYLIEAINILNKKYTDLSFIFVGRGPLKDSLEKKVPSNVKILSEVEHKKLMQMYNNADLIVIPSTYEAFGLVVGEAMIMEKPIVATSVDGIVEMITDKKEGLLVQSKDSNTLADAIERLYKDKDLRDTLAKNAKEKIKQFDTKIIVQQWKRYYEDMLDD